ncbi:MAG: HEAT repeat domain-containing protein [Natrialbaceae archaeon]|nr:HEAT repeat domain-containing protein [Natrialbaceae archaeon]
MILLALESFDSDFMEDHCLDALERLGDEEAIDTMLERVGKRDQRAVEILGTTGVGSEAVVEAVRQHADAGDEHLRRAALITLGQIGATAAIQDVADQLLADDPAIRSVAARALGLLGDTRTIAPLSELLADDPDDTVRGSAAWALNQIGTEEAIGALEGYTTDSNYLVQAEAERARS